MAMRKHLTWYCRNFRGAAEMRAKMTRANSAADVGRCLEDFVATQTETHEVLTLSRQSEFPSRLDAAVLNP